MKKALSLAVTVLASTYFSPISANENNSWYIGGLYSSLDLSGLVPDPHDFSSAGILGGYQYNEYFYFEARFSKGVEGAEYNFDYRGIEFDDSTADIDYQWALLVKAAYPVTDVFNFYATAGLSQIKIDQQTVVPVFNSDLVAVGSNTYNTHVNQNGFTYGVGLSYQVNNKFNIFIDYQILPDWEPISFPSRNWDSINIGFKSAF